MKTALLVMFGCLLAGCGEFVDQNRAVGAVEDLGFTDVRVVDRSNVFPEFDGCGKNEAASFTVQGKNPRGVVATVTVCCGLMFKGCTVRH